MTEVATLDDTRITRVRRLGEWLDNAIRVPGTRFRVGFDALIGLIPGVGDAIGAALSIYVVLQAARLGASRATLARMLLNVGVDSVIGAIPAVGDIFDFGWKANTRNVALLNAHLERPDKVHASSRRVLLAVGAVVVLVFIGIVVLSAFILNTVAKHL